MINYNIPRNAGRAALAVAVGLLAAAALAGCSMWEDVTPAGMPEGGALAVRVSDAGYAGTRAADEGLRTVFTAGDRVGLYAVRAGTVLAENLCLTLGADGKWTAQTSGPLYHESGASYYAYYPWRADMSGNTDPSAGSAEEFFAPLAAAWTPAADQSTHEKYTQWDLMTCVGTVGAVQADGLRPLTLGLTHRMSVAAVELPGTKYRTPDGWVYATPVEVSFAWGGADCMSYRTGDVYRILYNPAAPAELSGGYVRGGAQNTFAFTPDAPGGSYKVYRVDGGIADGGERSLKAGDLYYSDGSILPVETAAGMAAGTAPRGCIGIVFQTDPSRISAKEKELFAANGKTPHGVAMSVKSAGDNSLYRWHYDNSLPTPDAYTRDESIEDPNYPGYYLPNIFDEDYKKCYALADADINGYFNTEVIKVRRAADLSAGLYPAFKAAADFSAEAGGPEPGVFTSGWYMPSNGQCFDFLRNIAGAKLGADNLKDWGSTGDFFWENNGDVPALLNAAMSAIPNGDKTAYISGWDNFWTSSAASAVWGRRVNFGHTGNINSSWYFKDYSDRVRCAFAF